MAQRIYVFGDCRLDIAARELLRADERVTVSPTVFDSLTYLIEHRERAVGRDELVAAVWGTTGVTDSVLGKSILRVRRAIGDNGEEQNAIRTVPRFGFRWVADVRVEELGVDTPETSVAGPKRTIAFATPMPTGGGKSRWRRIVPAVVLVLIVFAIIGVATVWQRDVTDAASPTPVAMTPASDSIDRFAVLPVDVSASSADEWLRLGLMDLIAHDLRDGGLAVAPSESIVRWIDSKDHLDTDALRKAIGAHFLVESSLRRTGATWVLHVEMARAGNDRLGVDAQGANPIVAARKAANQLLGLLGKAKPLDPEAIADLSLTELSQRIEAAMLSGDVEAASQLLDAATPAQRTLPELRLRSAQIDYRAGRIEAAYRKLAELRGEIGAESDPVLRAHVLDNFGKAARLSGDLATAGVAFDEAIALLKDQADPAALGQVHVARGINYAAQGRYSAASDDFSLARTIFQSIDDRFGLTMVKYCEGLMEDRRNRPLAALAIYDRVDREFEEIGALNELASVRSNQVLIQVNLLRYADALAASDRSLPLLGELQNQRTQHLVLYSRANALAAVGQWEEALTLFSRLATQLDAVHESLLVARLHVHQADIELQAGRPKAALDIARSIIGLDLGPESEPSQASAWLTVIRSLLKMNRQDEARTEVARFAAWSGTGKDAVTKLYSQLAEAETALAEGRYDVAWNHYASAMQIADRDGVPIDIAAVATSYGHALIVAGELTRAATVAGRVSRYAEQDFTCAMLLVELYHAMGQTDAWSAAFARARTLAGERPIPANLEVPPRSPGLGSSP